MSSWIDCEPLSQEWYAARLGVTGSSEFSRIVTPKQMKLSSQAPGLMHQKLAEWWCSDVMSPELLEQLEGQQTQWMRRGQEIEDDAVRAYEIVTETETSRGGFFLHENGLLGCSPDRLIGKNGDLELKAPIIKTQVGYAVSGFGVEEEYMLQVQGRLMLHGREWVDIFSYHPMLSLPPVRVYRKEEIIKSLEPALRAYSDLMLELRLKLEREHGPRPKPAPLPESKDFISDEDVEAIIADRNKGFAGSSASGESGKPPL